MARPKLHSDEAILDAAQRVLLRNGPAQFTLSDAAKEIGISRAALIQRFTDRATLHLKVMERNTQEVRDYFADAPAETGLDALWTMLKDLIAGLGDGDGFAGYLLLEWSDVTDPALNALAQERNRIVRGAILERLPKEGHSPEDAASLLQAVIQGATIQWLVEKQGPLNGFVTEQTRLCLAVLYPDHRFD